MKNKILKFTTIFTVIAFVLSITSAKTYADPSSSHGFADFDDNAAAEQTNTLIEEQEQDTTQSNNNYLASLQVEGFELSPEFNKQTISYEISDTGISTINVVATPEDNRATVSGTGTIKLNAGENDIKINVTAESGTVRTYHIKINADYNAVDNEEISNQEQNIEENSKSSTSTTSIFAIIIIIVIVVLIIFIAKRKK